MRNIMRLSNKKETLFLHNIDNDFVSFYLFHNFDLYDIDMSYFFEHYVEKNPRENRKSKSESKRVSRSYFASFATRYSVMISRAFISTDDTWLVDSRRWWWRCTRWCVCRFVNRLNIYLLNIIHWLIRYD